MSASSWDDRRPGQGTRQGLDAPQPGSAQPRPSQTLSARWRPGTRLFLTTVWVLLWRDLSLGTVITGLLIASVLMALFPLPAARFGLRPRPWPLVVLIARFLWDLVLASVQVAYVAVAPWARKPVGRIARVHLSAVHDLPMVLTAEMVSLVPGSLVVDLEPRQGILTVHLFDARNHADVERAIRDVHAQEERVMAALFSYQERRQLVAEDPTSVEVVS